MKTKLKNMKLTVYTRRRFKHKVAKIDQSCTMERTGTIGCQYYPSDYQSKDLGYLKTIQQDQLSVRLYTSVNSKQ